jgi:hypothetical protein
VECVSLPLILHIICTQPRLLAQLPHSSRIIHNVIGIDDARCDTSFSSMLGVPIVQRVRVLERERGSAIQRTRACIGFPVALGAQHGWEH